MHPFNDRRRMQSTETITRFEVIDHRRNGSGRNFVAYDCQIELSHQDGGRTLKVFVNDRPKAPARPIDPDAPFDYQPYKHPREMLPFDGDTSRMKCIDHWRASRDFWYTLAAQHVAARRGPMAEYAIKRAREFQRRLRGVDPLGRLD